MRRFLVVLLGALALAALYGRVALAHLTTGVVGGDVDGYENLWNHWWVQTALFDLHQSPFFTQYIYYPTGVSLRFHTLSLSTDLLALPLDALLGWVVTSNLIFLSALALTTLAAYALIQDLVGHRGAAFAGALLVTYGSAHVLAYYGSGQDNLISAEWLPLYCFCLFRAVPFAGPVAAGPTSPAAPPARPWRWVAAALATLLIMSLTDWQWVLWAVLITLLYGAWVLAGRGAWRPRLRAFGRLAGLGAAYTAIALPLLVWPMIQEALANPWLSVSGQSAIHALDLGAVLGPGADNPGYLAYAWAAVGLVAAWRAGGRAREIAGFWALAAALFYLLALGPTLTVGGQATGLPLPYALLSSLPVLDIGRDPGRFEVVARLGVAILAAFGLHGACRMVAGPTPLPQPGVGDQGSGTRRHAARNTQYALLTAFVAVSLAGPVVAAGDVRVDPPEWPPFYAQLAQDPAPLTVLELPLFTENGRGEDHYQMYQVLHGKPRFGGRWARDHKLDNPNNFVKHASLFRQLFLLDLPPADRAGVYPARDFLQRTDYATQGRAILQYYHVGYIVVYKAALDANWDAATFAQILGQILGPDPAPVYDDALMRVYRVPSALPPARPLTLDVGEGWYDAGARPDGTVYRWANSVDGQASELYTLNLTPAPLAATLRFTILAFGGPRAVVVAVDGAPAATLHLTAAQGETPQAVALILPPGAHVITLTTPEPPRRTGDPHDARLLSFALYGVSLTSAE